MGIVSFGDCIFQILTADRIIHEQLLIMEWQPPEVKLLKKEELPSYCGAMCALKAGKIYFKNDLFKKSIKYVNFFDLRSRTRGSQKTKNNI